MSRYPARICVFTGKRANETPPPRTRCEADGSVFRSRNTGSTRATRCSKKAADYAVYNWGSMALCEKHLDEECGPITVVKELETT